MNILFQFLERCCKVKRVFLSVTKLHQHTITMRQEVIWKTVPSMLRLSLWDVFDSSLNPPARWSSSLHKGKQSKGSKEHLNKMCTLIVCVYLCVYRTCPPYWRYSVTSQLLRGAGLQTRCWNHHSEQGKQLHFLGNHKSPGQTLKISFLTIYTGRIRHSVNVMKGTLPVCRSTTKWQVVASPDPSTETQSVIGKTKSMYYHYDPEWLT